MSITPPVTPPPAKAIVLRSGSGAKTWIENRFFKAGSRIGIMSDLPPASIYLKSQEIFQNATKTYNSGIPTAQQGLELDYDPTTAISFTNWASTTQWINMVIYDLGSVVSKIIIVIEADRPAHVRRSNDCSSYTTVISQPTAAPIVVYTTGRCIAIDLSIPGNGGVGNLQSAEAYLVENPELSFNADTITKIRIASRGNWWLYEVMPL
jgi:hypothetical protein